MEQNNLIWLSWAKELQSIAQNGLTYTKDVFDKERFERLREISAEIMSLYSDLPVQKVKDLFCNEEGFQTPKIDTRAVIFKDNNILLVKEKDNIIGILSLSDILNYTNNKNIIKTYKTIFNIHDNNHATTPEVDEFYL